MSVRASRHDRHHVVYSQRVLARSRRCLDASQYPGPRQHSTDLREGPRHFVVTRHTGPQHSGGDTARWRPGSKRRPIAPSLRRTAGALRTSTRAADRTNDCHVDDARELDATEEHRHVPGQEKATSHDAGSCPSSTGAPTRRRSSRAARRRATVVEHSTRPGRRPELREDPPNPHRLRPEQTHPDRPPVAWSA